MSHSRVLSRILVTVFFSAIFSLALSPILRADEGPGLGNRTYPNGCARIGVIQTPEGEGNMAFHHGFLVVIWAPDSGQTGGGFSFWDMSDPRTPRQTFNRAEADIREPHGFGFSDSYTQGNLIALQAQTGIQIWNWTNHSSPSRIGTLTLPGIGRNSDYSDGVWWVHFQAPFIYVGGSGNGLYVVNATNPTAPSLVRQVPASTWGGARIGPVHAIGNLLVLSNNDSGSGRLVTMDISDPGNPRLIQSIATPRAYSSLVNGNRVFQAGAADGAPDLIEYRINDNNTLTEVRRTRLADKGGYLSVQDGFVHIGASAAYQKVQISNGAIPCRVNKTPSSSDWDFGTVLGNVVTAGNDHGEGTSVMAHQAAPDTTPPAVNMVNPRNGATNQALTSRVGITLTDAVDVARVNSSNFIVRPVGSTTALPGKYSTQFGIVNFSPNSQLQPGTTYEVIVTAGAGAIRDYAGNPIASQFRSTFTTAGTQTGVSCTLATPRTPATVGSSVSFSPASTTGTGLSFEWNFGDGATATTQNTTHTYSAPGHYPVTLKVSNSANPTGSTCSARQTIHNPVTSTQPTRSSTIAFDAARNVVVNVNSDHGSISRTNNAVNPPVRIGSPIAVGGFPQTVAVAPNGNYWVPNRNSDEVTIVNGGTGAIVTRLAMPRGSRPFGVAFSPDGAAAYVTLEGTGRLLKLNPSTGAQLGTASVGLHARGIAISGDSQRVFVTRFISPQNNGEIREINAADMTVKPVISLRNDPGNAGQPDPDNESNGRGVPNYIGSATVSPDGRRLWVPSKKDNTSRGLNRDGRTPTFETTVRAIVSQIAIGSPSAEVTGARVDIDDRAFPTAVTFTPLGDYAFVSTQDTNTVEVFDVYTNAIVGAHDSQTPARRGGRGMTLASGNRLYLQNFISRTVSAFDVGGIINGTTNNPTLITTVNVTDGEVLPANVIAGKRIFYNAFDERMNTDNYISCATCHNDGGQDGRVFDFTNRGEGFRNTVELNGRSGMGHGRVHWSGNFNEMQDFCNDITGPFGGDGFGSTCNQPLGAANAGVAGLDDLAAFVASLTSSGKAPSRNQDGTMTADAQAGQVLFGNLGCNVCHIPSSGFTDSVVNSDVRHNVGTIKPTSGGRLNKNPPIIGSEVAITGIDTPTLIGVWATAPYLHDGSAATLLDVLTTQNTSGLHGNTSSLSATQLNQLVAYMQQLEGPAAPTTLVLSNLNNRDTANPEWSFQSNLQNGQNTFGDRTTKWSNVGSLAGSQWIRTAADSKAFTGNPLVSFSINIAADVFVAIDNRITPLPSFLTDGTWTDAGFDTNTLEGTTTRTQNVFRKRFNAGTVSLGPQANSTAALYSIIVRP